MDEVKYMQAYNRHSETASLILQREGREKLEWLHSQIVYQFQNYSAAANSSNQAGGFLARLARGGSASKIESLKPKIDAYADVLKADAEAISRVVEMSERITSSWAKCPKCGDTWWKSLPEGHLENCDGKSSTERKKEIDSKKDGLVTEYYSNGEKLSEGTWVAGKKEGTFRSWLENGQLRSEVNYVNGLMEGRYREWWENGQLKTDGAYVNDKPEGLMRDWDSDGSLSSESRWLNGKFLE